MHLDDPTIQCFGSAVVASFGEPSRKPTNTTIDQFELGQKQTKIEQQHILKNG